MTTTNTINTDIKVLDKSIQIVDFIKGRTGTFRAIVKVRAGFMTSVSNNRWENIYDVFSSFKKGTLQTIEFIPADTNISLNVFAMKGKKCVIMDKELAEMITVGDVNSTWSSTNLYSQDQYRLVNATSWISKVFVINE
jgi:hypothetical protein